MKGKSVVNFLSYIAIAFVAVALILARVFGWIGGLDNVVRAMELIAQIIAYAITAVFAFYYAKSRKQIGWMIAYVIFVVVIVVFLVLGFSFK